MKLYYWLRDWQLPGQQHKGADRVEVPTDAAGLCAWLNERRVPICLPLHEPQLAREPTEAGSHIVGPPTRDPPRVSPAFLGDLAAGAEFVPVAKAAELDRLLERCPRCHQGAAAALQLARGAEISAIMDWVCSADDAAVLQLASRIGALAGEIQGRTVQ